MLFSLLENINNEPEIANEGISTLQNLAQFLDGARGRCIGGFLRRLLFSMNGKAKNNTPSFPILGKG